MSERMASGSLRGLRGRRASTGAAAEPLVGGKPVDQIEQYRTRYWDFTTKRLSRSTWCAIMASPTLQPGPSFAGRVEAGRSAAGCTAAGFRRPLPGMRQDASPFRWLAALDSKLDLVASTSAFLVEEESTHYRVCSAASTRGGAITSRLGGRSRCSPLLFATVALGEHGITTDAPFPIRRQSAADRKAARWGCSPGRTRSRGPGRPRRSGRWRR